jgi:spore germination cell wall hydrolase CwlJ-like protein
MTPKFFSGMSKQAVERLLSKVILLALTLVVVASAVAGQYNQKANSHNPSLTTFQEWFDNQIHSYENETWEQRVRRLMRVSLEEAGGIRQAVADKQVRCLAENVYHESRGESLKGQVAVAKVTLNRLEEGYARTVCGVVKQKLVNNVCQFSWVCEGVGSRQPSGFHWNQAVGVALVALNESDKVEDPTRGATHFHATYIDWKPTWKRVKDSVQQIGNHVFYRVKPKEEK